jgi:RHS repeat-associated protein
MGSVRGLTDEYGVMEERYVYDAFGNPYRGEMNNGVGLGYTGKPYDVITGMYNYGYRDYKPEVARFTTEDPVRDGANWFAYVNNDPVNWVDLWGLDKKTYTNSSAFWGGSDGGFGDTLVTTNVTVDTDTNTVAVTTLASESIFITAGAKITTTAIVSINGSTYDAGILSKSNATPSLTTSDVVVTGATALGLPSGFENLNTTVITISTFTYYNGAGTAVLGTATIEVPIGKGDCGN